MRPEQQAEYIVQCIRDAGSMYEDDARQFLAEHDAHVRADALAEAAAFVDADDDCTCGGCDTCQSRKLADSLRQMAAGKHDRAAAAPDFFRPGHVYAREHHARRIEFHVIHIAVAPDCDFPTAFGWRKDPEFDVMLPMDSDDTDGWTDVTEAGERS